MPVVKDKSKVRNAALKAVMNRFNGKSSDKRPIYEVYNYHMERRDGLYNSTKGQMKYSLYWLKFHQILQKMKFRKQRKSFLDNQKSKKV